jgi:pimeloyl-ACP methyl ester carboxylesterase
LPEHNFHRVDGVALAVYERPGDALPVLFQHGLGGDQQQCREAFPEAACWRRVTVECRGHGRSELGNPDDISLQRFANDLIDFMEKTFVEPVVVGGISMGAALSLRIAVTRPDLVRGLILVRPAWLLDAAPETLQPNAIVGELLQRYDAVEAESRFLASETAALLNDVAADNLASLRSFFQRPDARQFGHILTVIAGDGPGITPAMLQDYTIPTRILATSQDYIHPLSLAHTLAELLDAGPVVELPPKQQDKHAYLLACRQAMENFLSGPSLTGRKLTGHNPTT